jgi:cytoskeletal protein CcmA (bactofilin family)
MRHLTLTFVQDHEARDGSRARGERPVKNPVSTQKEPSSAQPATALPALPKEGSREVQRKSVEPGGGSENYLAETILVRGTIEGQSDLTIEGRVDGPISLGTNHLTIGRTGQVNGNIQARNITILGGVVGDVVATEKVEIADSGRLVGGICAPRISVSDGAHFKGSVDMASLGQATVRRPETALLTPAQPEHADLEVRAAPRETAS